LKIKLSTEQNIILISVSITAFLIALGLVTSNQGVISNAFILFAFMLVLPLILLKYERERSLREMEEKMPLFLRDLVESIRSGMPLHQAIMASSKMDYGALSKEVNKMANQISWGMPVNKVLDHFIDRVKSSKRLFMALKILKESYFTGGDVISTLESVSNNLNELNDAGKERRSLLNQHMVLMYALVFIFVVILVAMNKLMVPIFQISSVPGTEVLGIQSPCMDNPSVICLIFALPAKYIFNLLEPTSIGAYYLSLFFYMSTIVAISCGLVVGQIMENSVIAGLKHSLILTVAVWGILLLLKVINFLGV
jgi:flagellar protein FlaJ